MPDQSTYQFYLAYVNNVRDFSDAETEIRRGINRALKTNKQNTANIYTKLYALLYSTFSEASFMKVILTPYGFEQSSVEEILKQNSIQEKWKKCIDLGFNKFNKFSKGSEIPNKSLQLKRIVDEFVVDPSIIRNKVAHGQLTIALNSKNSSLNPDLTKKISELDVVKISRWFVINKRLCEILEDLIESPGKAHYSYYYAKFQDLEAFIKKSSSWSVSSKMQTKSMKKVVRFS